MMSSMSKTNSILLFSTVILMGLSFSLLNNYFQIYGHNFSPDESADFLTFLDEFDTEMIASMQELDNVDMIKAHLEKAYAIYTTDIQKEISEKNKRVAKELSTALEESLKINSSSTAASNDKILNNIRDILTEAEFSRLDPSVKQNSTIQALRFANVLDLIQENYQLVSTTGEQNNLSSTTMQDTNISAIVSYDDSKVLFSKLKTIYSEVLQPALLSKNATESISIFDDGLEKLQNTIVMKMSYNQLLGILHGTLHSELLKAFNLNLKQANSNTHDMSGMYGMSGKNSTSHSMHN